MVNENLTSTLNTAVKKTFDENIEALNISLELLKSKPLTYLSFMCCLRAKALV
jgi:hypothetical protein